jgi:chromosome segregation ATPase
MDNSLIAGMPEVIAYIKKIEEENKALKENEKKLARGLADQTLRVCQQEQTIRAFQACVEIDDAEPGDIDNYIQELKEQLEEKEEEVSLINSEEMENEEKIALLEERCETTALERDGALDDIDELKKVVQQRAFRIIELENDLESTTNYWKSKYENEVDTNKMLMEAIEANSTD